MNIVKKYINKSIHRSLAVLHTGRSVRLRVTRRRAASCTTAAVVVVYERVIRCWVLARQTKTTTLRTAEVDDPRSLVVCMVVQDDLLRAPWRGVLPGPGGSGSGVVALGDPGVVVPELRHSLVRPTRKSAVGLLRPGLVHNTVGICDGLYSTPDEIGTLG